LTSVINSIIQPASLEVIEGKNVLQKLSVKGERKFILGAETVVQRIRTDCTNAG
jgi:hypothetical protein